MVSYYDKDGFPLSLEAWSRRFEDLKYRIVAQHNIGSICVSTIWVGLDQDFMNMFREVPLMPLIFESMVFEVPQGDDIWRSLEMRRYRTLHEAMVGHAELVHMINTLADVEEEVSDEGLRDVPDLRSDQEDPVDLTDDGQG